MATKEELAKMSDLIMRYAFSVTGNKVGVQLALISGADGSVSVTTNIEEIDEREYVLKCIDDHFHSPPEEMVVIGDVKLN